MTTADVKNNKLLFNALQDVTLCTMHKGLCNINDLQNI